MAPGVYIIAIIYKNYTLEIIFFYGNTTDYLFMQVKH